MKTQTRFLLSCIASITLLGVSCKKGIDNKPGLGGINAISNQSFSVSATAPTIILKLDDFGYDSGFDDAGPALDWLISENVKASIGVVASRIQTASKFTPYINAKYQGMKLFEIWNHGLLHKQFTDGSGWYEFWGPPLTYQRTNFTSANDAVFTKLGVNMHSFGAPYNRIDANTSTVITENPNYKVVMLTTVITPSPVLTIDNRVSMESSTAGDVLDTTTFKANYNAKKDTYSYMILQGHPPYWDAARLARFKAIIGFLKAQGCTFVLPYEYYFITKGIKTTVYQYCSFGGWGISLGIGSYDQARLASLGVTNDDISSIKVPAGLKITLYQDDNFTGTSSSLISDVTCFGGLNNQVSSLVVSPAY